MKGWRLFARRIGTGIRWRLGESGRDEGTGWVRPVHGSALLLVLVSLHLAALVLVRWLEPFCLVAVPHSI